MTDEIQTPAPEAGDDAVLEQEALASEATENTEGQEQDPPAEDDAADGEKSEDTSPSKARRERRRAEMERLRQSEAETKRALEAEQARRDKILKAAQQVQPPKESDFADYNDYLMAAGAFHAQRAWDDRQTREIDDNITSRSEELQRIDTRRQQEIAQEWAAQVQDAKTRYTDFEQVAYSAPISDDLAQLVATSDRGADVAYYLGSNRQEAERIATLPPLEQARALGAIEARLSAPRPPKTPSRAPEPISPVRGKASALKDPDKMTMAEYAAARRAGKI